MKNANVRHLEVGVKRKLALAGAGAHAGAMKRLF